MRLEPLASLPPGTEPSRDEALACPAVRLFIQHAAWTHDHFDLDDADIPHVVEICRRLDGLPLALELAAIRADVIGVKALAASLSDPLKPLTRGARTAVPRHQTLHAALDWSYAKLPPVEQVALCALAVFEREFDDNSARAVLTGQGIGAQSVSDILASLVGKSLLLSRPEGDAVLFQLLQTTRAYALQKLRDGVPSDGGFQPTSATLSSI